MPLDIENIPTELIEGYLSGKCGFFVGAGLSIGAGFPDWRGLLQGLIDKAEADNSLSPSKTAEEIFANDQIEPRPVHNLLVTLKKNNFIITTNYDLLIEKAFVNNKVFPIAYKYYEAHAIQRQLFRRDFFLLKAHGDAMTAAEHIVLTDKDYRRLLYQQPGYQSALQSIFTMYSVIFVGCSLEDPELKLLLSYINAAFPEGGIPHYALMTTEITSATERGRWKKDYNMRIIPISSAKDYEDIDLFLKILHEKENEH